MQASAVSFKGVMPDATHRQRVLKDTEKTKLAERSPRWLQRILNVALETCISRGDLLRLRWDDIDWEDGVIVPDGGRIKTGVRQAAPLTPIVKQIFEELKAERQKMKVQAIGTKDLVFRREDGKAITRNALHKAFTKACRKADIKDFRFHDCRHTAKTGWARRGIPVEAAMLGAGHKSIQMHQAYVHLQRSDVGKAFGTAQEFYCSFKTKKKAGQKG